MKKYFKFIIILLSLVIAMITYRFHHVKMPAISHTKAKIVEVQKVTLSKMVKTEEFIATIKSKKYTKFLAQTSGILNIVKESGEKVKRGDIIAYIDLPSFKENYENSELGLKIAKDQYERSKKLIDSGIINKTQIEEKKTQWIKAKQNLLDAKNILEKNNIKASFDGTVGTYDTSDKSYVNVGDLIVNFYDSDNLLVEFDLPVNIAKNIQTSLNILIMDNMYKLNNVQKIIDSDNLMCKAFVDINCNDCIIGSTTKVVLNVSEKKSVITIPEDAIFLRSNIYYVYIVIDNKAIAKHVQPGLRQKNLVEIKHGLDIGDVIIIKAVDSLNDNQKVKILND